MAVLLMLQAVVVPRTSTAAVTIRAHWAPTAPTCPRRNKRVRARPTSVASVRQVILMMTAPVLVRMIGYYIQCRGMWYNQMLQDTF